jgi:glutathione S-transferase
MSTELPLTFFHAPHSRAFSVRVLLEELGVPYTLHALDLQNKQQRQPEYLAINPMGKVPAIRHGDTLVTEQSAVLMYLADRFAGGRLAPGLDDPARGDYLRWMVYYSSCFEPAIVDRFMQHPPAPASSCPYGDFDTMLRTLTDRLEQGEYMLGSRYSAADVLWGSALHWTTGFKLVPELPLIRSYIDRIAARPAFVRAQELDAALAAQQAPAPAAS